MLNSRYFPFPIRIVKKTKFYLILISYYFQTFTDGITNKLVACQLKNGSCEGENIILIRIYGNKTDLIIDRNAELRYAF